MKFSFKLKHKAFIASLCLVILSFLFFGREQHIYHLILLTGIILSLIFFFSILLSDDTLKSKIFWTLILFVSILVQIVTEPILINASNRIFLIIHDQELSEIISILRNRKSEISITQDTIYDRAKELTENEKMNLLRLINRTNVIDIVSSDQSIYFELWGFLDERIGLTFWTSKTKPTPDLRLKHLKDNWFY